MKIVLAPDSFKGALSSPEVCAALKRGLLARLPGAEIISLPMADGGEGTTAALVSALSGQIRHVTVHDPLMRPVKAFYGVVQGGKSAVLEMASAAGIELLTPEELTPLHTTTYGVGELLNELRSRNVEELIMGIGGSATVDGGAGMLQALGMKFYTADEELLPPGTGGGSLLQIARIDRSGFSCPFRIKVACDVTNPLLGPKGAAAVFAPQKGADASTVKILERNLMHWSELLGGEADSSGDGAAGGLGFALRRICAAEMVSGARLMIDAVNFRKHLEGADWVITGEGCTDSQTAHGKLCSMIALAAEECEVPVILASGTLKADPGPLFAGAFSISRGPCTLKEAIASTAENLEAFGYAVAGILSGKNR